MTATKKTYLATAALLLIAGAASAQRNTIKTRTERHTVGNSSVNVTLAATARAENVTYPWAGLTLDNNWKLFSARGQLYRLSVFASYPSSFTGYYRLMIGGSTRDVGYPGGGQRIRRTPWARALPRNASITVWVTGVPITVGANAGVSMSMDLTYLDYGARSRGAAMSGRTAAYAFGSASASIGIPWFRGGVQADLRLGTQEFEDYIGAWPHYLSTWALDYEMTPVRLWVRAFLEVGPARAYATIVDRNFGQVRRAPFIN